MSTEAGGSGALYRCTRCHDITDNPSLHNLRHHGGGLSFSDFALRRGALHNPTGRRERATGEAELPYGEDA